MKYLIAILLLISFSAHADIVQWSQGYTANCDNPTERTDGTTLDISEIKRVEYFISTLDGLAGQERAALTGGQVVFAISMIGGCAPVFVDVKSAEPWDYFAYGVAVDTEDRASLLSVNHPITIQKANPNVPVNLRKQ